MAKQTITKDMVPEGYSAGLALFDAVPVLLFGAASLLLWKMTSGILVLIGGIICFVSGMLKVLWKFIVVIKKKNVWPLFTQMRKGMPAGLMLVLIGFIIACFTKDLSAFWSGILRFAPIVCILIYFAGTAGMVILGKKLDPADPKANWIEQGCNTIAQGGFFLAMLLTYLK